MSAVQIVADLVRCSASLLICGETHLSTERFPDFDTCRASLAALIARSRLTLEAFRRIVRGRCRQIAFDPTGSRQRERRWEHARHRALTRDALQ